MHLLEFPLFRGHTVNRWLVTDVREELVRFEPVTLDSDYKLLKKGIGIHDNPCKTRFVEEQRTSGAPEIQVAGYRPGGEVRWSGSTQKFRVWYPFDDINIDLSYFWSVPTHVSAYAATHLLCSEAREVPFQVMACGGLALWLNGEKLLQFTPYQRNTPAFTTVTLPLQAGENRVEVWWNDLAERDTVFQFRLTALEETGLTQAIPVGEADVELLRKAEKAMESLAFTRNHYTAGELVLTCDSPFADRTFEVTLQGATEENEKLEELVTLRGSFAPGAKECPVARSEAVPFGFLRLWAETVVEGVPIGRFITVENFPHNLLPAPAATGAERKRQSLEFLAEYGERNANQAIAMLYTGGDMAEVERIMRRQIAFINSRSDCSDFYLVLFPHVLRRFGQAGSGVLPASLEEEMRRCVLDFRYWIDEPGDDVMWFFSENHALLFHICQLLAGELYPEEVFTNSGLTGRQQREKAEKLLHIWFEGFFQEGLAEWNSPAYFPIDSLGFACLYEGASSPALRDYARRGLDYLFYLLAIYGKEGCFASTAGRTYLKEMMGNFSNCTSFMMFIGYGVGNASHAGKGSLPLCFSDYEPPAEYEKYIHLPAGQAMLCQTSLSEGFVDLYCYKTKGYALATAADYSPGKHGHQENPLQLTFGPTAQLWINHPGELALYGPGRPSYWAGNGEIPRVNQYKGFAGAVFRTGEGHPVAFTHLYFPTMEFDRWQQQDGWLFGEAGGHYCAVYAAAGIHPVEVGPHAGREFTSPGYCNLWLVRAGTPEEFPSFEAFTHAILSAPLEISPDQLSYAFTDPVYGKLRAGWESGLTVDGEAVRYTGFDPMGEVFIQVI